MTQHFYSAYVTTRHAAGVQCNGPFWKAAKVLNCRVYFPCNRVTSLFTKKSLERVCGLWVPETSDCVLKKSGAREPSSQLTADSAICDPVGS